METLVKNDRMNRTETAFLFSILDDMEAYLTRKDSRIRQEVENMGDEDYIPLSIQLEQREAKGKADGLAAGLAAGLAEGFISLWKDGLLSESEAAKRLGITVDEFLKKANS